jgi:hypothetical protein
MSEKDDSGVRIFSVETRFQQLARRSGGISREAAIEKAAAKVEEIKPGFEDWLDKEINSLTALVKQVEEGKAPPDWLETANLHSRQLRDVGTTMDFELLTFIANSLCEILDAFAAGSECKIDSITCHIDALLLARQQPYRNLKPQQVPQLTNGLRRVADQVSITPT